METRSGETYADFGGEARRFRILIPELEKIQEECDAGPGVVAQSLARGLLMLDQLGEAEGVLDFMTLAAAGLGDWKIAYVRSTIFHGLIGGGMPVETAMKLRRQWIDDRGFRGLVENLSTAYKALTAASASPKDEAVGEFEGAAVNPAPPPRSRPSRAAKSASPSSAATRP